ncbi:hypothetical protein HK097_004486 [Rhizophlyctis rosea]|uniref:RRM domain-containing protein n=1 Tax=Rhizophlyctis rosea TaxID=64517 RepID=A0AAD5SFF4_9FUNG|nr:hypothetical protein HK097_004486 [Rhizophlyctis rosea]
MDRLVLSGIPPNADVTALQHMLTTEYNATLVKFEEADDETLFGLVTFPAANLAQKAVTGIPESATALNPNLDSLHIRFLNSETFQNSTVKLSWFASSRIAWVHFASHQNALKAAAGCDGQIVDNRKIKCTSDFPITNADR